MCKLLLPSKNINSYNVVLLHVARKPNCYILSHFLGKTFVEHKTKSSLSNKCSHNVFFKAFTVCNVLFTCVSIDLRVIFFLIPHFKLS